MDLAVYFSKDTFNPDLWNVITLNCVLKQHAQGKVSFSAECEWEHLITCKVLDISLMVIIISYSLLRVFAFLKIFLNFLYCSGFCHTLKWNSHGFTCVPHPDPLSHLPLRPIPLGLPSAPGPSACLMHPTWAGDLFHPR